MKSNASSPVSEQQRSGGTLVTDVTALFTAGLHLLYGSVPKQAIEKNVTEVLDRATITQIVESKTQQLKGFVESPLFGDLDFRTKEQKVEEALVLNPLAQETTAQNPQQAIKVLMGNYNSIDLVSAKMGHPGTINRIARDVVNNDLVEQAKGALNRLAETNPDLAEKGRQALRAAQTTTPAMQTMLPGWGQNVLDLRDRAERISSSSPNFLDIQNALDQFGLLNQEADNGNIIAQTFIEEINTALGPAEISNQAALGIGRDFIPTTPLNQMTFEELRSALLHMNQNLFGADVTPRTNELLNPTTPQ
jgi:hypothetical protein